MVNGMDGDIQGEWMRMRLQLRIGERDLDTGVDKVPTNTVPNFLSLGTYLVERGKTRRGEARRGRFG